VGVAGIPKSIITEPFNNIEEKKCLKFSWDIIDLGRGKGTGYSEIAFDS